ncbi:MAG TPA: acetyltransferase [Salinivirgaceae bacterium]|nr:acetyltransferase [Salinivirgaceae bacterium]
MKTKCIIIGAGTYGQVYATYLNEKYNVIAFYDNDATLHHKEFFNIPVKGGDKEALKISKDIEVFVPIGNNAIRTSIIRKFREAGFKTPSFIHEKTIIDKTVNLGNTVYILPGTNIMPHATIGDCTMISMGVNIAHHTTIADGCFFSQGTNIGASIQIKELAYIGISATLMTGVKTIGRNALIGAGAVVIKDVPDNAVMAGVPAKLLRYKG